MSIRSVEMYVEDIMVAIDRIFGYVQGFDILVLENDQRTIDAVVRNLEIIGEAANSIPENVKSKNPEVPWYEMRGIRNMVVHEYFGVDLDIIWQTINEDLPLLRNLLEKFRY